MKKVISLICCLFLFLPLYGCGKNPDYNLNYSLEKIFNPEHYSLSILPWFTTYEETCDILKLDELSEKDYKLEEEKKQKKLTIYNVKLEELHYPFTEFVLFFQKDPIANQTYTLCAYAFDMNFKMSGKTIGAMSDWGNREKKMFEKQEAGWVNFMEKMREKYERQTGSGDENPFVMIQWEDSSQFTDFSPITFSDGHDDREVRCTISPILITGKLESPSY